MKAGHDSRQKGVNTVDPGPQGTLLGMPYDFTRPSVAKFKARMWSPGGPMLRPHVFGWGYTLNMAHWGSWCFIVGMSVLLIGAALLGG